MNTPNRRKYKSLKEFLIYSDTLYLIAMLIFPILLGILYITITISTLFY